MTKPQTDGRQFAAEAAAIDDEERIARDILARKARERDEKKRREAALSPDVVEQEPVDPEDDPLHMELANHVDQAADGELIDRRNGKLVEWNDSGLLRYAPEWPHRKVMFKGTRWEYRDPKRLAQMFLAASTNSKTSPQRRMEGLIGFLTHVLSERSMSKMQDRAFDYDDDFDVEEMGRLMQFVQQKREGDVDAAELDSADGVAGVEAGKGE